LIHLQSEINLEGSDRQPAPQVHDDGLMRGMPPQVDKDRKGDQEGGGQHPDADPGNDVLGLWAAERQGAVHQESDERKRDGEPHPTGHQCTPRALRVFISLGAG
jgi:hypothetical protein